MLAGIRSDEYEPYVADAVHFYEDLAPRARFELATLRLTARECKSLNALFGVAYREKPAILGPSVGILGLPHFIYLVIR